MIASVSILIPTYNNPCYELVREIHRQAEGIHGLRYEILVADDVSTDKQRMAANDKIEEMTNCRLIRRKGHLGGAGNRNQLAKEAQFDWLLFLDCHVMPSTSNLIYNYITQADDADIVCGGITIEQPSYDADSNLRYLYEKALLEQHFTVSQQQMSFLQLHYNNLFIKKSIVERIPFLDFGTYGYSGVIYYKKLKENDIAIKAINNPICLVRMEPNAIYVAKEEEAIRTLHNNKEVLKGYSHTLRRAERLSRMHLKALTRVFFELFHERIKDNLLGEKPSLVMFKIYKLGYFYHLEKLSEKESRNKH